MKSPVRLESKYQMGVATWMVSIMVVVVKVLFMMVAVVEIFFSIL